MPAVYRELEGVRDRLEEHFRDMQDIEFTVQRGELFVLQCRAGKRTARAAVRMAVEMVKEGSSRRTRRSCASTPSSIDQLLHPALDPARREDAPRARAAGEPRRRERRGRVQRGRRRATRSAKGMGVILVRVETSPEDVGRHEGRARGPHRAGRDDEPRGRRGARDGQVLRRRLLGDQRRLRRTAVMQSPSMTTTVASCDTQRLKAGDVITLDGGAGQRLPGRVPTAPAALSATSSPSSCSGPTRAPAARARQRRHAARRAHRAKLRRRRHRPVPHRAHVLRRRAHPRHVGDDPRRDAHGSARALDKLLPFQRDDFVGIFRAMSGLPVTIRLL